LAHAAPLIAIDARPRGIHGPWAEQSVAGRPILAHHLALARRCGAAEAVVIVDTPIDRLARLLDDESHRNLTVRWATEPPRDRTRLSTDRLYDPRRLKRVLRRGSDSERAVIWRFDTSSDLDAASAEWIRRLNYQPLGHAWAWPIARRVALALQALPVRPNHLTVAACGLMLAAAACIALGANTLALNLTTALALALALILDTADGRLARLQGTATPAGRWLDAVLDELSDMALHAAIGWSLAIRSGHNAWLLVSLGYAAGKYLFTVARVESEIADLGQPERRHAPHDIPTNHSALRRVIHFFGHADVRWHLWIALALAGRLEYALAAYTVYYPIRVLAIAWKRMAKP
jgi:phosphatidylglycerophosphate synthase